MTGFSPVPNVTDFTTFLQAVVGISTVYLPPTDPVIGYAFGVAQSIVSTDFASTPGTLYALMTYNLGADLIINYAQDQVVGGAQYTFFTDLRTRFGIAIFVPGVVASSSNEGSSQSTTNPEQMKNYTLMDLQNLKTPYGRTYLAYAGQYGPLWGIS